MAESRELDKPRVAIIGYGRFGRLLALLLRDDFAVWVHDINPQVEIELSRNGVPDPGIPDFVSLEKALSAPTIIYAVPISSFEPVIAEHALKLADIPGPRLLIDVLSVKCHPRDVFNRYFSKREDYQLLLSHPLFGPDTIRCQGIVGQKIVLDPLRIGSNEYQFWTGFFRKKELKVVELSSDEHDRLLANSHGISAWIGRMIAESGYEPTAIDTLGARHMQEIMNLACNDSWQLFADIQQYNPYAPDLAEKMTSALEKVALRLGELKQARLKSAIVPERDSLFSDANSSNRQ